MRKHGPGARMTWRSSGRGLGRLVQGARVSVGSHHTDLIPTSSAEERRRAAACLPLSTVHRRTGPVSMQRSLSAPLRYKCKRNNLTNLGETTCDDKWRSTRGMTGHHGRHPRGTSQSHPQTTKHFGTHAPNSPLRPLAGKSLVISGAPGGPVLAPGSQLVCHQPPR